MGYTHLTDIAQFIPPSMINKSAGTWAAAFASNRASESKAAAAETIILTIPLFVPGSNHGLIGGRVKSVKYWYSVAVADLTSFNTVSVAKSTLTPNVAAVTGAAVANTITADNDSSAKRITQASHTLEVSIDNPAFIKDNEALFLALSFVSAAGSIFTHFGAHVYFDLRL